MDSILVTTSNMSLWVHGLTLVATMHAGDREAHRESKKRLTTLRRKCRAAMVAAMEMGGASVVLQATTETMGTKFAAPRAGLKLASRRN